jgi:hypothetical protein
MMFNNVRALAHATSKSLRDGELESIPEEVIEIKINGLLNKMRTYATEKLPTTFNQVQSSAYSSTFQSVHAFSQGDKK